MGKHKRVSILALLMLLCVNTGCEIEGRNSTSSSVSSSSNYISSSDNVISSNSIISSSNSTITSISTSLPKESQEFIDAVNSIVLDVNAEEAISNAFALWDTLEDWDYPEVLDAYNRLIEFEEEFNILVSNREKIDLFIEKILAFPEVLTLDDEYLIIRAEDSYSRLSDELKEDPEVIAGYEIMVETRELYQQMVDEANAIKDAEDIAAFFEIINSIPNLEELSYSHYLLLEEALNLYTLMSDNAKAAAGVEEAYQSIFEMQQKLNIKDGTGLFDIEILHSGVAWEAVLNIQGIDDQHKVTGINKVFELRISQENVAIPTARIMAWNGSPATSYTKSDGIHSFSFTTGDYYTQNILFTMSFIIETDLQESYSVSFVYLYQENNTYIGYETDELYKSMYKDQLTKNITKLIETDYTPENWKAIQDLLSEGIIAIDDAINAEHARLIYDQYYVEITSYEKIYSIIDGVTVAEYSSESDIYQHTNIVDNNTGTRWQTLTNTNSEYVILDLGTTYSVAGLSIMWETANAASYNVQVSNENMKWDIVDIAYSYTNGVEGNRTDEVRFNEFVEGRYVRLNFIRGSTGWGYSIYELDVYTKN